MEFLKQKVLEFWEWIPKWQFYGALGLAAILWVVRRYSLAQVVVVVAALAWFVGFALSRSDVGSGFGTNALNFAMLAGAAVAAVLAWFFFIRKS